MPLGTYKTMAAKISAMGADYVKLVSRQAFKRRKNCQNLVYMNIESKVPLSCDGTIFWSYSDESLSLKKTKQTFAIKMILKS